MILQLHDVHVYYGESYILQGISIEIKKEELVCLLGRNGAGKTTTMRTIMGYAIPKKGVIKFMGHTISGLPVFEIARKGIGYVPEDRRIFPDLSVEENLEVAFKPASDGSIKWTPEKIFETFSLLKRLRNKKGGTLSGGEQQLLAIARALVGNPDLILLDEPCEGLAPVIVEFLGDIIRELKKEKTILLAEQNARFALNIADRGYIIEKGKICFEGTKEELINNEEIQCKYLAV